MLTQGEFRSCQLVRQFSSSVLMAHAHNPRGNNSSCLYGTLWHKAVGVLLSLTFLVCFGIKGSSKQMCHEHFLMSWSRYVTSHVLKYLCGQNDLAMVAHTCREIKLLAKVLVTVFICSLISYNILYLYPLEFTALKHHIPSVLCTDMKEILLLNLLQPLGFD